MSTSPTAMIAIPVPTTSFVPTRSTSLALEGATTIIAPAIGSIRMPAWRAV